MLASLRTLAFLAPAVAFAGLATLLPELVRLPAESRPMLLLGAALVAASGAGIMATVAWIFVSRRLHRLARALDTIRDGQAWNELPQQGTAADRDVARALNAMWAALANMEARASRDRLTGIANRERILAALITAVERARQTGSPLSVGFVDIDRFKAINDAHGHASGDVILRQVAELVSSSVRGDDVVGRYGGEEFMMIFPDTDAEGARAIAERVRAVVMRSRLKIAANHEILATVSIGIATGVGDALRLDTLVSQADAAMYAAKSRGRNQTQVFPELGSDAAALETGSSVDREEAAAGIGQWAGMNTIQALASLLAPQPAHRGRPSDQIAAMATGLAARVGVPDAEVEQIRIASLLHDVGKLAVPLELLDKADPLTHSEWQAITEHARIGEVVIEQATSLRDAIPIVLHHHERYNGTGYPDGLKAGQIPIGARIVAIADAFHAMVHDRPYQDAVAHEEALAELRRMAGTQFDPDLVAAFCELYGREAPPDGLEEVYRLHEQVRGDLRELRPRYRPSSQPVHDDRPDAGIAAAAGF